MADELPVPAPPQKRVRKVRDYDDLTVIEVWKEKGGVYLWLRMLLRHVSTITAAAENLLDDFDVLNDTAYASYLEDAK